MKKEMLINCLQPEETRIAILEDGVLEELYVERNTAEAYVGNIYKGRIVNVEPSIQAAFVDFGEGRNGFLHISDVDPQYFPGKVKLEDIYCRTPAERAAPPPRRERDDDDRRPDPGPRRERDDRRPAAAAEHEDDGFGTGLDADRAPRADAGDDRQEGGEGEPRRRRRRRGRDRFEGADRQEQDGAAPPAHADAPRDDRPRADSRDDRPPRREPPRYAAERSPRHDDAPRPPRDEHDADFGAPIDHADGPQAEALDRPGERPEGGEERPDGRRRRRRRGRGPGETPIAAPVHAEAQPADPRDEDGDADGPAIVYVGDESLPNLEDLEFIPSTEPEPELELSREPPPMDPVFGTLGEVFEIPEDAYDGFGEGLIDEESNSGGGTRGPRDDDDELPLPIPQTSYPRKTEPDGDLGGFGDGLFEEGAAPADSAAKEHPPKDAEKPARRPRRGSKAALAEAAAAAEAAEAPAPALAADFVEMEVSPPLHREVAELGDAEAADGEGESETEIDANGVERPRRSRRGRRGRGGRGRQDETPGAAPPEPGAMGLADAADELLGWSHEEDAAAPAPPPQRQPREQREPREPREPREVAAPREQREPRESRPRREPRDQRPPRAAPPPAAMAPRDDHDRDDDDQEELREPSHLLDAEPRPPRRNERGPRTGGRDGGRGDRSQRPASRDAGRTGVRPRERPPIQDVLQRGQEILVQVIKEGIGNKGPTLSTYISIPGRYLVLMPGGSRVGVSRKILDDDLRRDLRRAVEQLDRPDGLGVIIRTAGLERGKDELQRDLGYLTRLWEGMAKRLKTQRSPCSIYQESDMLIRTIRDVFAGDIDTIWIDEPEAYARAKEFLDLVMPQFADRLKLYQEPEPLFHRYGVEDEIHRITHKVVPLPRGGSIVIEQTEALVAIDVNSGSFRTEDNAEDTAYQMNLQAAREIGRQLRLRDLGGVIVNDFIDMRDERHRRGVEEALQRALARDRARTKVLRMSQFGLISMTRQRIRPSLRRSLYRDCPACAGVGYVKSIESMGIESMRVLAYVANREGVRRIRLQVEPETAAYLQNQKRRELLAMEERAGVTLSIVGKEMPTPEAIEVFCYDAYGELLDTSITPPPVPTLGNMPRRPAGRPPQRGRDRR